MTVADIFNTMTYSPAPESPAAAHTYNFDLRQFLNFGFKIHNSTSQKRFYLNNPRKKPAAEFIHSFRNEPPLSSALPREIDLDE